MMKVQSKKQNKCFPYDHDSEDKKKTNQVVNKDKKETNYYKTINTFFIYYLQSNRFLCTLRSFFVAVNRRQFVWHLANRNQEK